MSATRPGEGIDMHGGPVIDPTRNVLDLVEAAVKRLDDLAAAAERLSSAKHLHAKEMAALRADHAREQAKSETQRIDAIRSVDVGAAAIAAERAVAAASVLATQVTQSAEVLRSLVATTAEAARQQTTASNAQLSDRISLLERTSYEGSGKSSATDPQLVRMAESLDALNRNMAEGKGGKESRSDARLSVGMVVGIIGAAVAFVMLVLVIMKGLA